MPRMDESTAHQDRRNRIAICASASVLALAVAGGLSACDDADDGASQAELRATAIAYVDALVAASPERACRFVAAPPGRDEQAWQQQCQRKFHRALDSSEAQVPDAGEIGEVAVTKLAGRADVTYTIDGRPFRDRLRFRFDDGAWQLQLQLPS